MTKWAKIPKSYEKSPMPPSDDEDDVHSAYEQSSENVRLFQLDSLLTKVSDD